jgi:hypothetical protein
MAGPRRAADGRAGPPNAGHLRWYRRRRCPGGGRRAGRPRRVTRLACGFAVSTTTAWRYVREAVDLLAAHAEELNAAIRRIGRLAYAILDGTLIPIGRVADQRPYYSGKHKRHGVNVQVVADCAGRLIWASPALPGAAHDLTAARTHGLIDALTNANVMTFADKAYQGASGGVRTPFKHRSYRRGQVTELHRRPGCDGTV